MLWCFIMPECRPSRHMHGVHPEHGMHLACRARRCSFVTLLLQTAQHRLLSQPVSKAIPVQQHHCHAVGGWPLSGILVVCLSPRALP